MLTCCGTLEKLSFYAILRNKLFLVLFLLTAPCLALHSGLVGRTVDLDPKNCFFIQRKVRVKKYILCVQGGNILATSSFALCCHWSWKSGWRTGVGGGLEGSFFIPHPIWLLANEPSGIYFCVQLLWVSLEVACASDDSHLERTSSWFCMTTQCSAVIATLWTAQRHCLLNKAYLKALLSSVHWSSTSCYLQGLSSHLRAI